MFDNFKRQYRVKLVYKRGEKPKAYCYVMVGSIMLATAVAGMAFAFTGCTEQMTPKEVEAQQEAFLKQNAYNFYQGLQLINAKYDKGSISNADLAHSLSLAAVIEQPVQGELEKPDAYRSKVASSWKLLSAIDINKSGLKVINGKTSNDAVDVTFPRLIAAVKALCANAGVSTWTPSDGLSLSTNALNLTEGDVSAVTANVTPDAASDKSVSWVSDNPGVATVDASGKITAVAAGNATVTASASPVVASAPVMVIASPSSVRSGVSSVASSTSSVSSVASSPSSVSSSASSSSSARSGVSSTPDTASRLSAVGYVLEHGSSYPAVLTPTLGSLTLSWHSSDTSVVTVDSASGKITAVGAGPATVYATVSTAPSASVKTSVAAKPAYKR